MKNFKILTLLLALTTFGCEEFLKKEPYDIITDDIVILTEQDAQTALLGVYAALQSPECYGNQTVGSTGVLSDELIHSGSFPTVAEMDNNSVLSNNVTIQNLWSNYYVGIYRANVIIERVPQLDINQATKNQLVGEAMFLRALMHFDLAKLFGGIPYATTTDYAALRVIDRTDIATVYSNIIADLNQCVTLLDGVDFGTSSGNRANDWVAKALLARVLLYSGDEAQAAAVANDVIENGPYSLAANYEDAFEVTSTEAIFYVFFNAQDQSQLAFYLRTNGRFEYSPSPQMVAAFEAGDDRAAMVQASGNSAFPFQAAKYTDRTTGTDHTPLIRLAEMYLIRAEGNIGSASADNDVNTIRNRAGLGDISGVTLDDILQERFVELCFEGHRWNDLVRTGRANTVMAVVNPSNWQATDVLLPIPQREIQQNPTLVGKQNPGY